jgi:putative transposase
MPTGAGRAERLWRSAKLQRPRRRIASSRVRPSSPVAVNHVWAYDFAFDACANGQQLKCCTIVDEFTHECLAVDLAGGIRSARVIAVLGKLISVHGAPGVLRSDNGPKFVSAAILRWLRENRIDTALIDPGKPWQNVRNRREAKIIVESWRRHYNAVRSPTKHSGVLRRTSFQRRFPGGSSWRRKAEERYAMTGVTL